jgi:hypothetical protein
VLWCRYLSSLEVRKRTTLGQNSELPSIDPATDDPIET